MAPIEDRISARWIEVGTHVAFTILVLSFAIYALQILDPLVPLQDLVRLWQLPVDRFVAQTGAPTGWAWLRLLGKGDYLNLLGVAVFVVVTIACYARMVPLFIREGKRTQALFAFLQVVVLLAAASGLFR
jgi:hypothetical protein